MKTNSYQIKLHILCFSILTTILTTLAGCSKTDDKNAEGFQNNGVVSTLAGMPGQSGDINGPGATSNFADPAGVAVDSSGNVYVAVYSGEIVKKITPSGVVSTLAGSYGNPGTVDGLGSVARFEDIIGVGVDSSGNIYTADSTTVRKITPAGLVTSLAGADSTYGMANGTGNLASFNYPRSVAVDGAGNVFVADSGNNSIRKITAAGVVTTFAGTGAPGSLDGSGVTAQFNNPQGIAIDISGNLYVADTGNDNIRKITPAGLVSTIAGGVQGDADGEGTLARFNYPAGIAVDKFGSIYVADSGNHTIRKISATGTVTTIAGVRGVSGFNNGPGLTAKFDSPWGIAVDKNGKIYVGDQSNQVIRKIE